MFLSDSGEGGNRTGAANNARIGGTSQRTTPGPAALAGNAVFDRNDLKSRSLGSAIFPADDTEESVFYTEVLMATQRWFTQYGWPSGVYPITIPEDLRTYDFYLSLSFSFRLCSIKLDCLFKKAQEIKLYFAQ